MNQYNIIEISERRYMIQTYTKEFGWVYVLKSKSLEPKIFSKEEAVEYIKKWL